MKHLYLALYLVCITITAIAQTIIIDEGAGIGQLRIGQTYDDVVNTMGFTGKLKSYDDYLADELFMENPNSVLECIIGFDYYIKYTHLITLPVSYIFFRNNTVVQIKVTSFPEYLFSIANATSTQKGLKFWDSPDDMQRFYGKPQMTRKYDTTMLESSFYFNEGIAFSYREDNFRIAHIFRTPSAEVLKKFESGS